MPFIKKNLSKISLGLNSLLLIPINNTHSLSSQQSNDKNKLMDFALVIYEKIVNPINEICDT